MEFDPNKALAYARALSRPRLVGGGEDERVAQEIVARLDSFGYRVEREPFQFTRAFELALLVEIGLALTLIVLALVWPTFRQYFGIALLGLLILAQPLNRVIHQHAVAPDPDSGATVSPLTAFILRWGRRYRAANIVARHKHFSDYPAEAPVLYLVAHFDSKSQRLPIVVRMVLIVLFLLGTLTFALAALSTSLVSSLTLMALGVIVLACGAPLLFLDVGNDSPGAIDNASGCGLVLHLAEYLNAQPELLSKVQIVVLITSAEEMATLGAIHHVHKNQDQFGDWLNQGNYIHILNFDGVGTAGKLYCANSDGFSSSLWYEVQAASHELKIPIGKFLMPGALFDHVPFAQLDALSLLTVSKDSWAVHTAHDSADKLHPRGFEQAGRVALKVIESLSNLRGL